VGGVVGHGAGSPAGSAHPHPRLDGGYGDVSPSLDATQCRDDTAIRFTLVSVDAKRAPSAKHTASRTSWLHTCKESQDVPVNFPEN
jgi:hypothetical protein